MSKIVEIYTKPDQFFEKKMEQNIDLMFPFLIYLVSLIILHVSLNFSLKLLFPYGDVTFSPSTFNNMFFGLAFIWFFNAMMLYMISIPFGGRGFLKRVFEFVGYTLPIYIPMMYFHAFLLFVASNIDTDTLVSFSLLLTARNLMTTLLIIVIFTYIACANTHRAALRFARELSNRNATIVAGIYFFILILIWILGTFRDLLK